MKPERRLSSQAAVAVARIAAVVGLVLIAGWLYVAQPRLPFGFAGIAPRASVADPDRLEAHVRRLSEDFAPRSFTELDNLNAAADYIAKAFAEAGAVVSRQWFQVNGRSYQNVIGRFGPEEAPLVVVGAHYDSHGTTPGADDNASGVAGLLELARLFGSEGDPSPALELVAYTLEEPPFFGSADMGSRLHARTTREAGTPVRGVVVLEMIGYFSDAPGSQDYPIPALRLFYPDRGNFIAVVGSLGHRRITRKVRNSMRAAAELPVHSINAPAQLPGIDFSDHRNYWAEGFDAVMVTDTAFYRNKAYHTLEDTWDRLDYRRMAQVVDGVRQAVEDLMPPDPAEPVQ